LTKSFSAAAERLRLASPTGTAASGSDAAVRELMAVREIVHAFLTAIGRRRFFGSRSSG